MQQPLESADTILTQIKQLFEEHGGQLSKKDVKKQHPEIMRSALYYFPSWEHALTKATE
ncbi:MULTISPECIES: hypothetical protein [Alicyclobacillus]|uniref:Uncharacterized protein n=1 Tax=Alicyclobacillus acidoterrestris (strain ATCC 49025 / DSM 3922 / CIP 106132 / NCIMB 13137 / GD3B) TaxID=1356854 RepID=T0D4M2_ALIAG|nr:MULTISPECIES: hypothetical protein [Alicyclobacillus]EPZ44696.1 hypothetical protein N007_10690 [Alicyclobacillus acidoterrestris ATCC 49025]UNO50289.1 hypothetical protein K1I37_07395 [Alicyclobacillus acidoterrestris]GEO25511.1 hypothetical protein AAC03nite_12960 [Alicyclobacillus acidoterrestris]